MSTDELEFDAAGNLIPYRLIPTDWEVVKKAFVNSFPTSETRAKIWTDLTPYLNELKATIGTGFEVWIDGSFVTRKANPADVDFVVFVSTDVYQRHLTVLNQFRARRRGKSRTDGYFVEVYPRGHPSFHLNVLERRRWQNVFNEDRQKRPKGFLTLLF